MYSQFMMQGQKNINLRNNSLGGSQKSTGLTDQALLIYCSAKIF